MKSKRLLVVGGPNGAGKTTLANAYLAKAEWHYLGADKIAAERCPEQPESVSATAGREFVERLEKALHESENLLIESTLSGRSIGRVFDRADAHDLNVKSRLHSSIFRKRALHELLNEYDEVAIMFPRRISDGDSIAASRIFG